jgi:hypothetical protein
MKRPDGGSERGQGRHKVLEEFWERMDVAGYHEWLWEKEKENEAQAKYLANPDNYRVEEEVKKLQQRARNLLVTLKNRPALQERELGKIAQQIDQITEVGYISRSGNPAAAERGARRLTLLLKRPKGKGKAITALTIKYAREKYAKNDKGEIDEKKAKAITKRRIDDWVIECRNLIRPLQALFSLVDAGYGPLD